VLVLRREIREHHHHLYLSPLTSLCLLVCFLVFSCSCTLAGLS
jgi:hypothetical protein